MLNEFDVSQLAFNRTELSTGLTNTSLVKLLLKCPAASTSFIGAYLTVNVCAAGATLGGYTLVEILETPTTSSDGTAASAVAKNRLGTPPTCPVPVFLNTDATAGTLIKGGYAALGVDFYAEGFILKPSTNYLVRITNQSGANLTAASISVEIGAIPTVDYFRRVIN
jgi:hypothetical protein